MTDSAITLIEEMQPPPFEMLRARLENMQTSNKEKSAIIQILGDLKDRYSYEIVLKSLKNESIQVKSTTILALHKIGNPDACKYIEETISLNDDWVTMRAINALTDLKYAKTYKILKKLIENENQSTLVARFIIYNLSRLNTDESVNTLTLALKSTNKNLRFAACEYFAEKPSPKAVKAEKAVPLIIDLLEDKNDDIKEKAIEALAIAKDKRSVIPLIKAMEKGENTERALAIIGDRGATAAIVKKMLTAKNNDDVSNCISALAILKDRDAIPALRQQYDIRNNNLKDDIIAAIRMIEESKP
jgi:HEAT repeat protein